MISCEVIRDRKVVENRELLLFVSADLGNSTWSFLRQQQNPHASKQRRHQPKSKESKNHFLMPKTLPRKQTFCFSALLHLSLPAVLLLSW